MRHHDEYHWIGFFDVDEFLVLDNGINLKELFSREPYCSATSVRVTWHMYDDNGILERDLSTPVMQSFSHPNKRWLLSKSFLNCKTRSKNIPVRNHGDTGNDGKMIDICGDKCLSGIKETEMYHTYHWIPGKPRPYLEIGRLNHYRSKSLMEYIDKVKLHSKSGFNRFHFNEADKAILYYFNTPNIVTQKKIDRFIENGIVPSNELLTKLRAKIK